MGIDELLKLNERWNEFRITRDITSYGTPDAFISDFIQSNAKSLKDEITRMGNGITPNHFQAYLSQLSAFIKGAPNRVLGDVRGRRELEKILAETKKVQLDAFPMSTLHKVTSTISIGLIAAGSTLSTLFSQEILDSPPLVIFPGLLFVIGFCLLYWGLSRLNRDEKKKEELYQRLFPDTGSR